MEILHNKSIDISKQLQACNSFFLSVRLPNFAKKNKKGTLHQTMGRTLHKNIVQGSGKGFFLLPEECDRCSKETPARIYLNPTERTLFRLYLAHPEGIPADHLLAHWKELCTLYAQESLYDEPSLREDKMESLCAESKTVFYATVSRIKRKFIDALGIRRARAYFIQRSSTGAYYTKARCG